MVYPLRVALIIPSDGPQWGEQATCVENTLKTHRTWVESQTGLTFAYEFKILRSIHDLAWFQTANDGTRVVSAEGEGVQEGRVWDTFATELGWPQTLDAGSAQSRQYRHAACFIGGGGWAGGRWGCNFDPANPTARFEDYGEALVGSWEAQECTTGTSSQGAINSRYAWRFRDLELKNIMPSFSHEMLHMWGIECHYKHAITQAGDTWRILSARVGVGQPDGTASINPTLTQDLDTLLPVGITVNYPMALFYGDAWQPFQVEMFKANNTRFTSPLVVPAPTPVPAPTTTTTTLMALSTLQLNLNKRRASYKKRSAVVLMNVAIDAVADAYTEEQTP